MEDDPYRATHVPLSEPAGAGAGSNRGLRWVLVLPSAGVGFVVATGVGLVALALIDRACPERDTFEGMCTAPWTIGAFNLVASICAGIAAFLFVALPAWLAPSHKRLVAGVAYVVGALLTAVVVALEAGSLSLGGPPLFALVAGLLALWGTWRLTRDTTTAPRPADSP